jgi:energy-coupling factor transporter ATP-binding protein EcfA2
MSAVLRTGGLTRVLPGDVPVTLVEDITLEIEEGEFVAIMGPSGSGKSSLLYLLGLLDMPTAGKIWLNGRDTQGLSEDELACLIGEDKRSKASALWPLLDFPGQLSVRPPPFRVRRAITIRGFSRQLDPLFLARGAPETLEIVVVVSASLNGMHMRRELNARLSSPTHLLALSNTRLPQFRTALPFHSRHFPVLCSSCHQAAEGVGCTIT